MDCSLDNFLRSNKLRERIFFVQQELVTVVGVEVLSEVLLNASEVQAFEYATGVDMSMQTHRHPHGVAVNCLTLTLQVKESMCDFNVVPYFEIAHSPILR